ncbi:unnamed protein product [Cladocopium goreaui]|uniref:Surfactin synthase subunit 3 n=1 Tax=Cladocopium goreaui TaxID=2562237 RepID=A0A9P1FNZ5_9DINO|nr:unnamed protein product [Cladocopium goreaui]
MFCLLFDVLGRQASAPRYWLSFAGDAARGEAASSGTVFQPLGESVQYVVVDEDGLVVKQGSGELCLSGPMVTPGYWPPDTTDTAGWMTDTAGRRFFRTSDVVELMPEGGFIYKGRKDRSTKIQGQWVDLDALEQRVQDLDGIKEACVIESDGCIHSFLVPDCYRAADLLRCMENLRHVRQMMPWQSCVKMLPKLPRNENGKTDLRTLKTQLADEARPADAVADALRLSLTCRQHGTLAIFAFLVALCGEMLIVRVFRGRQREKVRWLGPLSMAYAWLALAHFSEIKNSILEKAPFSRMVFLLLLHLLPAPAALHLRRALAVLGLWLANSGRKMMAWPLVFWFGIGTSLHYECVSTFRRGLLAGVMRQLHGSTDWLDEVLRFLSKRKVFGSRRWYSWKAAMPVTRSTATQWEEYPKNEAELLAHDRWIAGTLDGWKESTKLRAQEAKAEQSEMLESPDASIPVKFSRSAIDWALQTFTAPTDSGNASGDASGGVDAVRMLELLQQAMPGVDLDAPLSGLDSLRVSFLTSTLRSHGIDLRADVVRQASSLRALATSSVTSAPCGAVTSSPATTFSEMEYAIWYTPGQHQAMGPWLCRGPRDVNMESMKRAVALLQERHPALRVQPKDPIAIRSFVLSCGALHAALARASTSSTLRGLGEALRRAWPRVTVPGARTIKEIDTAKTPFSVMDVYALAYSVDTPMLNPSPHPCLLGNASAVRIVALHRNPEVNGSAAIRWSWVPQLASWVAVREVSGVGSLNFGWLLLAGRGRSQVRAILDRDGSGSVELVDENGEPDSHDMFAPIHEAVHGVLAGSRFAVERNCKEYLRKLAYFLPITAKRGSLKKNEEKTFGYAKARAVFRGGGPFILEDSPDLAIRALTRLGYLDQFNTDVPEAMFLFLNSAENKGSLRKFGWLPGPGDNHVDVDRNLRAMKLYAKQHQLPVMRTLNGLAWSILRKSNAKDPTMRSVGQNELEKLLQNRTMRPPFEVALLRLTLPVEGVWECQGGHVSILRDGEDLVYVDAHRWVSAKLLPPEDSARMQNFLLRGRLQRGGEVLLRFPTSSEVQVAFRLGPQEAFRTFTANRLPQEKDHLSNFSFVLIQCYHSFGDGFCFSPIASDLFRIYNALDHGDGDPEIHAFVYSNRDGVADAMKVLQKRLEETLMMGSDPSRHSLRGNLWSAWFNGSSHALNVQGDTLAVLKAVAQKYLIPVNYLLLAIVIAANARASRIDAVEMTLYVPMRDGPESSMVGLFADWRDIRVPTPEVDCTLLGVLWEVSDILRLRKWRVFNALRKADRTVVNFDLRDGREHHGFRQVPESFWRMERAKAPKSNWNHWEWLHQPLQIDLVEEHSDRWCIHVRVSYEKYTTAWRRKFIQAIQDATYDIVFQPWLSVHKAFPDANQ